jgi:hypothetical protein
MVRTVQSDWRGGHPDHAIHEHGDHPSWNPIHKEHERCQLRGADLALNAVVVLQIPGKVSDVRGEPIALTPRDGGLSAG